MSAPTEEPDLTPTTAAQRLDRPSATLNARAVLAVLLLTANGAASGSRLALGAALATAALGLLATAAHARLRAPRGLAAVRLAALLWVTLGAATLLDLALTIALVLTTAP